MIKKELEEILSIDPDNIDFSDPEKVKSLFINLLNFCGQLLSNQAKLKEENQKLKDEINHLKGEKGKPNFKPNKKDPPDDGELESSTKKKKSDERDREPKKPKIKIDREEVLEFSDVEKEQLPDDAIFKGYREKICQDIKITTNNTLFKIPRWYSPGEGKIYEPQQVKEIEEFGPGIHSFTQLLYFLGRVPKDKITSIFIEIGTIISGTKVLEIINGNEEDFSKEKENIFQEGVKLTNYCNTDDTGIRFGGKNCHANVYCNPFFTAFKINENKKRETIERYLNSLGIKIPILATDDAPQFKEITKYLALCWIHEERHYKKLNPLIGYHKKLLKNFRKKIWNFYQQLKEYKKRPRKCIKKKLRREFDEMFSEKFSYKDLDDRIKLTKNKKENLLLVLDYPEVPLHNNFSEQEIREIVIKRKVSGGLRSEKGVIAWENHFTILRTCRKQNISYWNYIKNFYEGVGQIPLAQRVAQSIA